MAGNQDDIKEAEFYQSLLKSAMMVTKHSNELPSCNINWDYYQSFAPFSATMKHFNDRITNIMSKIYGHYGLTAKIGKLDFEEQLELVSDSNDVMMERINLSLDEASGIKKQAETVVAEMMSKTSNLNGSWNRFSASPSAMTVRLLSAKNILRPQLKFKEKINNKAAPFVPKIKEKPHSLKPLAILLELNEFGDEEFSHPYEFELERFVPDQSFLQVKNEIPPFKKVEGTPLVIVENEVGLKNLLADLSTQSAIGVDLEAHSYRSFQGITCLMQISTSSTDYLVDTLELWDQLQPLNEIFCNPKIVKIFHGADSDIEWLQRDFGLYVVNLFDTYQAAKLLNFSQLSLAFLLRHYCQVTIDKQYQLADWRIRPLPQEMVNYAREDTHYLGYIYERLKQDLRNKGVGDNLLSAVWQNSRLVCLKRYRIPSIRPDSHLELSRKSRKIFNERQLYALKELFAWRDQVARMEDESPHFVLPKHMMLQIAEVLPREMQGILACCSPVPPLVRQHQLHLHEIILKAREMPLLSLQNRGQPLALPKVAPAPPEQDTEDPLHCPHDLTHLQDIRDDLPTLLCPSVQVSDPMEVDSSDIVITAKSLPHALIFANVAVMSKAPVDVFFVPPYTRYARAKASASAEEKAELERVEKLRQHFIDSVMAEPDEKLSGAKPTEDSPETGSHSKSAETSGKKKKKSLPLSVQLSKKRKRSKDIHKVRPANVVMNTTPTTQVPSTSTQQAEDPEAKPGQRSSSNKKARRGGMPPQEERSHTSSDAASDAASFAPFDYSQVNYQEFQQDSRSEDTGRRRGRGRNSRRGGSGRGARGNSRVYRKHSQKSMTYSSK